MLTPGRNLTSQHGSGLRQRDWLQETEVTHVQPLLLSGCGAQAQLSEPVNTTSRLLEAALQHPASAATALLGLDPCSVAALRFHRRVVGLDDNGVSEATLTLPRHRNDGISDVVSIQRTPDETGNSFHG